MHRHRANFGEHSQLSIAIAGFKRAISGAGYEDGRDIVYRKYIVSTLHAERSR